MSINTPEYARKVRRFHACDRAFWATVVAGIAADSSILWLAFAFKAAMAALAILLWWLAYRFDKDLDAMEEEH